MTDGDHYAYGLERPVDTPPERIVSLVPAMTESLVDLGLGGRLIAVTTACAHPAESLAGLPRVGAPSAPDVARIAALAPDLVLACDDGINTPEDIAALRATGLNVWVNAPHSVQEVFNLLWNTMYLCDETAMVPRVRQIEYMADWLRAMSEQRRQRGEAGMRVAALLGRDPLIAAGGEGYTQDVLTLCGADNAFGDRAERWPQVALEDLRAARLDALLLAEDVFQPEDAAAFTGVGVAPESVHRIDASLLTWAGTRVARAFDRLPPLLTVDPTG